MNLPLISVIIPVYQGERLIIGAVMSALRQTHEHLEVFVVDDGSSDGTQAALATIDDARLTVLSQSNAGTAAARNNALARASGAYIAFLDSDDRWLPDKLATELALLQSAPNPIAVACSAYFAVDDRGRLLHAAPRRSVYGMVLDLLLDGDDFLMPSLCLFDRRIFEDIGHFNVGRYHEDHEFIIRVCTKYPIYSTGRRLAVYRQSTSGKCRAILSEYDRARREELALLDDVAEILTADQLARLRGNVLRSLYCRFLMYGFGSSARKMLPDVDLQELKQSKKGLLAVAFAKLGVNLLMPARVAVQSGYRIFLSRWWRRQLNDLQMDLRYD
jgi:glycosyltransferase involved in cell wall biosynthesis